MAMKRLLYELLRDRFDGLFFLIMWAYLGGMVLFITVVGSLVPRILDFIHH